MKYFSLFAALLIAACQSPTGTGQPAPLHKFSDANQVSFNGEMQTGGVWRVDSTQYQSDSTIVFHLYGSVSGELVFTFVVPDTVPGLYAAADIGTFTKKTALLVVTNPGFTSDRDSDFSVSGYIRVISAKPFHAQFDLMVRSAWTKWLVEYWGTLKSKQY